MFRALSLTLLILCPFVLAEENADFDISHGRDSGIWLEVKRPVQFILTGPPTGTALYTRLGPQGNIATLVDPGSDTLKYEGQLQPTISYGSWNFNPAIVTFQNFPSDLYFGGPTVSAVTQHSVNLQPPGYNVSVSKNTTTWDWIRYYIAPITITVNRSAGTILVQDPYRPDTDGDGIPDSTDPGDDNDGDPDIHDPAPLDPGVGAPDLDGDGAPDYEDTDDDGDGDPDETDPDPQDPEVKTPPPDPDTDGDGDSDTVDDDDDNDGIPDTLDPTPLDPTPGTDTDGDAIPDWTDPDDDNDGSPDTEDPEPLNPDVFPNPETDPGTQDTDSDGTPDYVDRDDDNDGISDSFDPYPKDPTNGGQGGGTGGGSGGGSGGSGGSGGGTGGTGGEPDTGDGGTAGMNNLSEGAHGLSAKTPAGVTTDIAAARNAAFDKIQGFNLLASGTIPRVDTYVFQATLVRGWSINRTIDFTKQPFPAIRYAILIMITLMFGNALLKRLTI